MEDRNSIYASAPICCASLGKLHNFFEVPFSHHCSNYMRLSNISAESRATWEALLLSVLTVFLSKISLENMCLDVKINVIMTGKDVLWSLFLLHKTKILNGSQICGGVRAGMGETFWKNQLLFCLTKPFTTFPLSKVEGAAMVPPTLCFGNWAW